MVRGRDWSYNLRGFCRVAGVFGEQWDRTFDWNSGVYWTLLTGFSQILLLAWTVACEILSFMSVSLSFLICTTVDTALGMEII